MQRDNTLDIGKGIVIILMCIGHTNCPVMLGTFICTFHMAFFFMASGWFFRDSNLDNPISFLYRRIKGLWWPFFALGVIFVLLHNCFLDWGILSSGNSYYDLKDILWKTCTTIPRFIPTEDMMGPYWFISSLFYSSLLLWLGLWIARKLPNSHSVSCGLFSFFFLIAWMDVWFDWGMDARVSRALLTSPILFLGKELKNIMGGAKWWKTIWCFVLTFLLLIFAANLDIPHSGMLGYKETTPLLLLGYNVCGFLMTISLSHLLNDNSYYIARIFAYIGRNTIVILLLNMFCLRIVEFIIAKATFYDGNVLDIFKMYSQWYVWVGYTVFMVVVPLSLNWSFQKIKKTLHQISMFETLSR